VAVENYTVRNLIICMLYRIGVLRVIEEAAMNGSYGWDGRDERYILLAGKSKGK
jgi:hypothetical protein